MKRLFLAFAIAGTLVACNNSSDSTAEKKDSIDSMASAKKDMIDSAADKKKAAIDSSAEHKKDALAKADSTAKHDTSMHKTTKTTTTTTAHKK